MYVLTYKTLFTAYFCGSGLETHLFELHVDTDFTF
jgi:hypothetical protein